MQMDEGLDTGPVFVERAVDIGADETSAELATRIAALAATMVEQDLARAVAGELTATPQDGWRATLAPLLKKEDGRIDWSQPAADVYNLMRAVAPPYPGAFTDINGQRLIVAAARRLGAADAPATAGLAPGLHAVDGRIIALCGDGGVIAVHRLLAGAREVDAAFLNSLQHATSESTASP
jgi:methionyl-tRNA formyltransferase